MCVAVGMAVKVEAIALVLPDIQTSVLNSILYAGI